MIFEKMPIKMQGSTDKATLTIMCHEASPEMTLKKRPLILVIPGGGYEFVSDREADPIATTFLGKGYNVAILHYSIAPAAHYPTPILEAFWALKYIKDNAERLNVLPDKIFPCGFSAGGHLAGMVGTAYNEDVVLDALKVKENELKPTGMILVYPVINGGEFAHRGSFDNLLAENKNDKTWIDKVSIDKRVNKDTPPTFIWYTFEDTCVPCENTLLMTDALRKNNIPFELHIFPIGQHGLALANDLTKDGYGGAVEPYCCKWVDLALDWLNLYK